MDEAKSIVSLVGTQGDIVRGEALLITKLVEDHSLVSEFQSCRAVLDEIADRASSGSLLKEILPHRIAFNFDQERLFNGIVWYGMAAAMGNLARQEPPILVLPYPHGVDEFPEVARQVIGSNVLMAYVALVYMRNDELLNVLRSLKLETLPTLSLYGQLLEGRILRHLRNALAHGTVATSIVGLRFSDARAGFEAIVTPGLLVAICTWVFVLFDTIFLVLGKEGGITREDESLHKERIGNLQGLFNDRKQLIN
ncbi:MAG: hypothetical protein ACE5HL_06600 [Terriglobia bacterium]